MVSQESRVPRSARAPDAYAVPSISRWIRDAGKRHGITLALATVVIVVTDVFAATVDLRVYLAMAAWIGTNVLMSRWTERVPSFDARLARYAWTIVIDVVFLGVVYFFLDAAHYLGVVFFAHMAITASATLPRAWAWAIAGLIVVVFVTVVVLSVYGPWHIASPIGLPPVRDNAAFLVASIAAAVGMVVLLMHLQSRMVKSIRDAEHRYLSVVQSASDMVMTFGSDGRFIDVNPATLAQSGYTWEELKRLPNTSFFPASDWAQVLDAFQRTMRGEPVRVEVRIIRKGGEERWVEASAFAVPANTDQHAVVIARDVTDAHRQTSELLERDARLALVLDALGAGFVTFDRDLRVTSAFGAWARARRDAGGGLVGAHATEIMPTPEVAALHIAAAKVAFDGEPTSVEWTMQTDADGVRQMRTHLVPLRDETGEVVGGAGLWVDETALRLAEQERERLRVRVADSERVESLGKLVSGVAHELNNPLAAILSFTEGLLVDARSPEERSALEIIQAQALRSRLIVRDLLTYARRDSERPRSAVAPEKMLRDVARAMKPWMAQAGVELVTEIAAHEGQLVLDRVGIEQVVTNLLTNAAHAAGSGGTVRLIARHRGDRFEVIVEDNGAGLDASVAARIFEPFFTTKPTGHGVGLGLSVSLGIVQASGGTLTAENRPASAGGGARFVCSVPAVVAESPGSVRAPADPIPEPISDPRALPERKPTILIIDDEGAIRQGLRRYFSRIGWAVEEAPDGADALAKLQQPGATRIYDVVLCDLKMAGVSGMDVYDRMLAQDPLMAARFILSTGDTSAPDVAGFLAGVSVPILEKPFDLTTVAALADEVRSSHVGGARRAAAEQA